MVTRCRDDNQFTISTTPSADFSGDGVCLPACEFTTTGAEPERSHETTGVLGVGPDGDGTTAVGIEGSAARGSVRLKSSAMTSAN